MNQIEEALKTARDKYVEAFKTNIESLDEELIDNSPVRWGGFKTAWMLMSNNPQRFKYRRVNNLPYALRLWRYQHSEQGWSPETGDVMVNRHVDSLREDLEAINKSIISA